MRARLIVALVAVVIFLVFAFQNLQDSQVQFLGWDWYIPTILLLLITLVLGLIIGWVLAAVVRGNKGRAKKKTKEAD